jgi:adhesin/invasin
VTITADATGRATAELQSDRTVGTARVRVTAFDVGYEVTVNFTSADPSQIITVSADPSSVPADGATPVVISARIAPSIPAGRRAVTFRTTLGQILPTTIVEADGSNIARVNLVSTTTGTARITATTADGVVAETTAQFTTALPDKVIVAPDVVQLKSGGSTTIRVTLLRNTGTVSSRLEVAYSAATSGGVALGSFSRVTLADSGASTATFNVDATAYLGSVTITASVGGITGTGKVEIIP